ncbi:MAG: DNRLRE domain-containing protein [Opitutales bacterium]
MDIDPQEYLQKYLEKTLSDDERRRLRDALRDDPEFSRTFAQDLLETGTLVDQIKNLDEVATQAEGDERFPRRNTRTKARRRKKVACFTRNAPAVLSIAAMALFAVICGFWMWSQQGTEAENENYFVTQGLDAVEFRDGFTMIEGKRIQLGNSYDLSQGYVTLGLMHQSRPAGTIRIDGPSKFSISQAGKIHFVSGTLFADIDAPPGAFEVQTPDMIIRDIGTIFGVRTSFSGQTEVHVYEGETVIESTEREGSAVENIITAGEKGRFVDSGGAVTLRKSKADPQLLAAFNSFASDSSIILTPSLDLRIDGRGGVVLDDQLRAGGASRRKLERSFIYFDLPENELSRAELTHATLRLMLESTEMNGHVNINTVAERWDASDAPPSMELPIIALERAKIATSTSPSEKGGETIPPKTGVYYSIDVTEAVFNWLENPDSNFGFCISEIMNDRDEFFRETKRTFASSRSEYPPQLVIHTVD